MLEATSTTPAAPAPLHHSNSFNAGTANNSRRGVLAASPSRSLRTATMAAEVNEDEYVVPADDFTHRTRRVMSASYAEGSPDTAARARHNASAERYGRTLSSSSSVDHLLDPPDQPSMTIQSLISMVSSVPVFWCQTEVCWQRPRERGRLPLTISSARDPRSAISQRLAQTLKPQMGGSALESESMSPRMETDALLKALLMDDSSSTYSVGLNSGTVHTKCWAWRVLTLALADEAAPTSDAEDWGGRSSGGDSDDVRFRQRQRGASNCFVCARMTTMNKTTAARP